MVKASMREMGALPRSLWVCAAVATINALCWAVITPTFWVPDEPAHAGYAQHLAEAGELPAVGTSSPELGIGPSAELTAVYEQLPFGVEGQPSWSPATDRRFSARLSGGPALSRSRPGQALNATNNPPLYYLLQVIPYRVLYNASFLDRLLAMRALSALFAGLTVLFSFLFLRQLLPTRPWAWTVGAATLAFQPVLGFIAGGVNNDGMVYALGAALLWSLARAFRTGLTPGTGALMGSILALGLLTKVTMLALIPGLIVAAATMILRDESKRVALKGALVLSLTAGVPFAAWIVFKRIATGLGTAPAGGVVSSSATNGLDGVRDQLGYMWQAVFPRLPFMNDQFPHYVPWDVYFQGFVGRFGWFEFGFPTAWYWVALVIFAIGLALVVRALSRHRAALRRRWPEGLAYLALFLGVLLAVEVAAYSYHLQTDVFFEQARYLFPVLALYSAFVALAAIGAGPRSERAVGALIVVIAMGHSLFSQLLTISRFYL